MIKSQKNMFHAQGIFPFIHPPTHADEILAKLECVQYCHSTYRRSCNEAPNVCGECMGALVDVAGSCVSEKQGFRANFRF